jgi:putative transposase
MLRIHLSMARNTRKSKRPAQLELPLAARPVKKGRGGARPGAGRKPGKGRRLVRHRVREAHNRLHPVHVVLRSKFRPLRSPFVFPTLRAALARAARARRDFRVVQFSVQADHLHLIVEANDKSALARGMQGLAIRIARRVNALLRRRGKVWADRFFSRALGSPRAVKHALAYVLDNFRKHRVAGASRIDPYSSAPYFRGFRELRGRAPCELPPTRTLPLLPRGVPPPASGEQPPVLPARTWLAQVGWRRAGPLALSDLNAHRNEPPAPQ